MFNDVLATQMNSMDNAQKLAHLLLPFCHRDAVEVPVSTMVMGRAHFLLQASPGQLNSD